MVTIDPEAIRFLQPRRAKKSEEEEAPAEEDAPAAAAPAPSTPETSEIEALMAAEDVATREKAQNPPWNRSGKLDLTPFRLPPYASPWIFIPAYIEPQFSVCSAIYLRHPTARPGYSEIPTPWDADGEVIRFAWEWYSRRRPRIRSKRQKAMEPENRRRADE
jgi:hypothetical protein